MTRTPRSRSGAAALPSTFPTPAGAVTAARTSTRGGTGVPTQRGRRAAGSTGLPAAPLGSLVTAAAPALARAGCPECGSASVTRLAMTLPDGAGATFVSCHRCESRGWFTADGAALGLDAVLGGAVLGTAARP